MKSDAAPSQSDLPDARIKTRRIGFSLVWMVPIIAAAVAGYLIYQRMAEFGRTITIHFDDVTGLKRGQTTLQYRGTDIGMVSDVTLSDDAKHATVKIRLRSQADSVAREGSFFWIVRPQLSLGTVSGLGTLVTGPYIEVLPGDGAPKTEFKGTETSPRVIDPRGLHVVLHTKEGNSLHAGVPVYYRGIEVGSVQSTRLSSLATSVEIHCVIRRRYAPLVRSDSKFWNITGLDVRLGLFRGAEVNIESMKTLLIGGIAFATPNPPVGQPVENGTIFVLHEKAEKEWQQWTPRIELPDENSSRLPPPLNP